MESIFNEDATVSMALPVHNAERYDFFYGT